MKAPTCLLIVTAFALGCGGPSGYKPTPIVEAPKVDASAITATSILPLKAGTSWTYAMQTQSRPAGLVNAVDGDLSFTIASVEPSPKGQKIVVELKTGDKLSDRQTWLLNDKGLYQLTAGLKDVAFTPMQPLVLFPVKEGDDFRWKGTGLCPDGVVGNMESASHVLGSQQVDTAKGKESGLAITTVTKYSHGKAIGLLQNTNWFKPNVGIVRLKQTLAVPKGAVETTLALKSTQ
jgi:hypothetical protein